MENDVDKIKKKIDNLDFAQSDLSHSINELNNKIKVLLKNISGFSNLQSQKKSKIKKHSYNDEDNNIDNDIINEKIE